MRVFLFSIDQLIVAASQVVAVVELDDRMHSAGRPAARAITKAAGYQTIRYQSRHKPWQAEIAALFQHAQAWMAEVTVYRTAPRPSRRTSLLPFSPGRMRARSRYNENFPLPSWPLAASVLD